MNDEPRANYYLRRAETERARAADATDPQVARIHREMASRYAAAARETGHTP